MRYVYSLVRFVPDPARGEFVNLGAIVGSEESSEWESRQVENPKRARDIDESKSLEAVWAFLDDVGRQIDDFERSQETLLEPEVELSEEWLWKLHIDHRNLVQLSAPAPMRAESAEEAFERLFGELVVDPARRKNIRTRQLAIGALRNAYVKHDIKPLANLYQRVALETKRYSGERIDFAVTNGHVLQLAQAWSFQVPDQDRLAEQVRSWGWTVSDLRKDGGIVRPMRGPDLEVGRDVDVKVVFIAPAEDQDAPAFRDAENVFDTLGVRSLTVERADTVAARARRLLADAVPGALQLGTDEMPL